MSGLFATIFIYMHDYEKVSGNVGPFVRLKCQFAKWEGACAAVEGFQVKKERPSRRPLVMA